MLSKGGYKLPFDKSLSVTILANSSADAKNISSGIVEAPAHTTPKATPGNIYELLPCPG